MRTHLIQEGLVTASKEHRRGARRKALEAVANKVEANAKALAIAEAAYKADYKLSANRAAKDACAQVPGSSYNTVWVLLRGTREKRETSYSRRKARHEAAVAKEAQKSAADANSKVSKIVADAGKVASNG